MLCVGVSELTPASTLPLPPYMGPSLALRRPFILSFAWAQASFLEYFAKATTVQAVAFLNTATQDAFFHPGLQEYGTLCSGTDMPALAIEKVTCAFNSAFGGDDREGVEFRQRFLVEVNDEKREFAMGLLTGEAAERCCAFKDVTQLNKGKLFCYRHKRECQVPRVNGT